MVVLPVLGIANAWYFGGRLREFLQRVPALRSPSDLEEFKVVVAHQMYAALLQIVLGAGPLLLWAWGRFGLGVLSTADILFGSIPAMLMAGPGIRNQQLEARAKAIPCDDPVLRMERDRIVRTWMRKPLPDW